MRVVRFLALLYKKLRTFWPRPACRHFPSCSEYALEAIEVFGLFPGGFLALKRLIRCNQFFPGGYDPVPLRLRSNVSRET